MPRQQIDCSVCGKPMQKRIIQDGVELYYWGLGAVGGESWNGCWLPKVQGKTRKGLELASQGLEWLLSRDLRERL